MISPDRIEQIQILFKTQQLFIHTLDKQIYLVPVVDLYTVSQANLDGACNRYIIEMLPPTTVEGLYITFDDRTKHCFSWQLIEQLAQRIR